MRIRKIWKVFAVNLVETGRISSPMTNTADKFSKTMAPNDCEINGGDLLEEIDAVLLVR